MKWIEDPLKKRIHWASVVLAVAGFIAWGLIAGDFRWAWISFAVFYLIRIESFVYLNRREKKRRAFGDRQRPPDHLP
jgi:hypothetical protein